MKRIILMTAAMAAVSAFHVNDALAKKASKATAACPSNLDSNGCEYYKDGVKAGKQDRAAHQSAAYERHADHYDTQNEPAFKAGYEKGWGVPKGKSSAAMPENANAGCPAGMEVNRCEYFKDGFKAGKTDRMANMSMAYERHEAEYNTEFAPYFRQGYEKGWQSGR